MGHNHNFISGNRRDPADFLRKEAVYLLKQAHKAKKERRYADCAGILELAVERYPEAIEIKELLARAYENSKNPNKAIWMWEKLCDLAPYNIDYLKNLAYACQRRGWYRKAISKYEQIIHIDPDDINIWEGLVASHGVASEHNVAAEICLNAIETLKARGVESAQLYYHAFFYTDIARQKHSHEYLNSIIKMIKADGGQDKDKYANMIKSLLGYYRYTGERKILSYIRKMVDLLPNVDDYDVADLVYAETKRDIVKVSNNYPVLFEKLFNIVVKEDSFDGVNYDLMAMECSILNDLDGYRPFLKRLKAECPGLYGLYNGFFDEALGSINPEALLRKRIDAFDEKNLRPALIRANNKEDRTGRLYGTYRREVAKTGRNDPCPCNSGRKYKRCCGA